jgi:acetyltransferase-like isoleucine patch superfamily enzyme
MDEFSENVETQVMRARAELGCQLIECELFATRLTLEGQNTIKRSYIEGSVSLGLLSYVNSYSQVRHAAIGRYCSVADEVMISPNKHPARWFSTHPTLVRQSTTSDSEAVGERVVKVGHDVWIGARAIIMGGVSIGNGAIIGAGAVVTKPVAAYEIVGGLPARVIGQRFADATIDRFEKLQWWNYDIRALGGIDMSDVERVLDVVEKAVGEGTLPHATKRAVSILSRSHTSVGFSSVTNPPNGRPDPA